MFHTGYIMSFSLGKSSILESLFNLVELITSLKCWLIRRHLYNSEWPDSRVSFISTIREQMSFMFYTNLFGKAGNIYKSYWLLDRIFYKLITFYNGARVSSGKVWEFWNSYWIFYFEKLNSFWSCKIELNRI